MNDVFGTNGGVRYYGDSFLHVYASGVVRNVRPSEDGRWVRLSISLESGDTYHPNRDFYFYPQFSTNTRVNDLKPEIKNGTILNLVCSMTSKEKTVNGNKFHYENFMIDDMEIVGFVERNEADHEGNKELAEVEDGELSFASDPEDEVE